MRSQPPPRSRSLDGRGRSSEARLAVLEETARAMALAMEFGFLLDRDRKLLSIGYLVPEGTLDPSCYDLLASEARLASFMAIAKGDVPARHWFRLGRAVTPVAHGAALISWSGSMFEYLMPSLVMRAPAGSLIEQTSRLIVRRQIDYAASARPALGHLGIRLQRPRPGIHLPIFELRRPRPRAEARPRRKRRRRALCDRARDHGRSAGGGAQFRRGSPDVGGARPLRLLRGPGLHADPGAGGQERRDRAGLHGAPPGHDDRRHRRCVAGRRDAGAVPRRADRPGDGTAAAGAHAARRRGGPSLGGGSEVGRQDPANRAARRPAVHHGARRDARHAPALERPLRGDAHGRRLRLQPLARICP